MPSIKSVVGSNPTQGSSSLEIGKKAVLGVVGFFVVMFMNLKVESWVSAKTCVKKLKPIKCKWEIFVAYV